MRRTLHSLAGFEQNFAHRALAEPYLLNLNFAHRSAKGDFGMGRKHIGHIGPVVCGTFTSLHWWIGTVFWYRSTLTGFENISLFSRIGSNLWPNTSKSWILVFEHRLEYNKLLSLSRVFSVFMDGCRISTRMASFNIMYLFVLHGNKCIACCCEAKLYKLRNEDDKLSHS
jgi:hypothetical protein